MISMTSHLWDGFLITKWVAWADRLMRREDYQRVKNELISADFKVPISYYYT